MATLYAVKVSGMFVKSLGVHLGVRIARFCILVTVFDGLDENEVYTEQETVRQKW